MPLVLAVIVLIAAEIAVLVEVAKAIGVAGAIVLVLLISAAGPWLVRRAGVGVWRRTRERVAAGQPPGREALDGVALLAGGVLVCVPGFITDVVGLALLLPPVRALAGRLLLRHFVQRLRTGPGGAVITVGSHRPGATPPGSPQPGSPRSGGPQPGDRPLEPPR